jgi:hypothetical protein
VVENLGWQPGIWASFFLVLSLFLIAECSVSPTLFTMEALGVVLFVGLALALWQVAMHRRRTVLVRDGGMIQVFRKRRLDMVLAEEKIRLVRVDIVVMMKVGAPLLIAAALFFAVGITMLWRDGMIDPGALGVLALGVTAAASLASACWTIFFRRHLRVPVRNSRWIAEETVLVSPRQFDLLFLQPKKIESV